MTLDHSSLELAVQQAVWLTLVLYCGSEFGGDSPLTLSSFAIFFCVANDSTIVESTDSFTVMNHEFLPKLGVRFASLVRQRFMQGYPQPTSYLPALHVSPDRAAQFTCKQKQFKDQKLLQKARPNNKHRAEDRSFKILRFAPANAPLQVAHPAG